MAVVTVVGTPHVWLDGAGVPWIDDTNTKVIEVVRDHNYLGLSPAEIHFQHPHLSLAQVHAALAYYYDHQPELDADMERRDKMVEAMQKAAGPSAFQDRLRAEGRLP